MGIKSYKWLKLVGCSILTKTKRVMLLDVPVDVLADHSFANSPKLTLHALKGSAAWAG